MEEQENEIEKAVISVAEYRFDEEYTNLVVPLSIWSSMSQAQRKRHLERIKTLTLQEAKRFGRGISQLGTTMPKNSDEAFTICGEHFNVDGCQLSADILHNMFHNAERLVLAPNSTCPSAGSSTAKLVESKSHILLLKKLITDIVVIQIALCGKACSHTIACAYQDKCLQDFLSKITETPNFYALSKSGTHSNAGKKAHKCKACTKSSVKALSSLQDEVQSCPTNSSFPVTQSTEPAVFSTHNSTSLVPNSRIQANHVSFKPINLSAPVSTSCTLVASKPTPETSQSISALLTYVPQCSVSVSQGAQGAVHVSPAVLASPQSSIVLTSVGYCTFSSLPNVHTTSVHLPRQ